MNAPKVKQTPKPPKPCLVAVAFEHGRRGEKQQLCWKLLGHFPSRSAAKRRLADYLANHEPMLYLVLNAREKGGCALYDYLNSL